VSAKPEGTCRLCAKDGPLTFEHIPPRSAGNSDPLKGYSLGAAYRQAAGNRERYVSEQKGAGRHALCAACNTLCSTRRYVYEMAKWVTIFNDAIDASLPELRARGSEESATFTLGLKNVYPGRLVRQMVVQLLAINEPLFGSDHQHLRDFVIDASVRALAPGTRLFLSIETRPRNLYVPATAVLLADGATVWFSEVSHCPIRFGLAVAARDLPQGDVTAFATHDPSAAATSRLELPVDAGLLPDDLLPAL
jgi:hypothetical protein